MKIINYDTFVKLGKNIMYSFYEPTYTSGLMIKEDTLNGGNDWFYYDLLDNPDQDYDGEFLQYPDVIEKMENGESIKADFSCLERDGMFDYDRKFLIYEKEDIQEMINKLKSLLDGNIN